MRSAALDAVESCYVGLDMDSARIHRLLGAVNDKTKTLIDEVRTSDEGPDLFCREKCSSAVSSCGVASTFLPPPPRDSDEILHSHQLDQWTRCSGGMDSRDAMKWI